MKTLLLLLCLPVIAPAQGTRTYQLKNNDVIRAELLEVVKADGRVRYRFFSGGGSGIVTRQISDFDPHSQFNILRSVVERDDIQGHVQLAEFAVNNGLIAAGRRELFKARDIANDLGLAPELEERIMEEAVRILDGLLQRMLADEKMNDANYVLTEIMGGTRLTDAQKEYFTELVVTKTKEIEDRKAREREAQRAERLAAAQERQLRPILARLQGGKDQKLLALKNMESQSRALRHYDAAVSLFRDVQRRAETLTRRNPDDPDFTMEIAALSRQAEDEMISSLLSQGSIYTTRGSFNQAMGKVGRVLAIDSQNQQALNMRARIEIAANSNNWFMGLGR